MSTQLSTRSSGGDTDLLPNTTGSRSEGACSHLLKRRKRCRSVSRYVKSHRIGQGTYGTVYRAVRGDGSVVALKKVILHHEKADGFPLTALREIRLLMRLQHPNVVKLHEVVVGDARNAVYLVFEFCEHDMASLIDTMPRSFSESEVKGAMLQLLRGLAYLHKSHLIHRDLKMSNLLYDRHGTLKLADFGLAREFSKPPRPMTPKVVTLWYRPPELLLGCRQYGTAIDLWGAGCVFGELLAQAPLLPGKTEPEQMARIMRLLGRPTERIWPGWSSLPNASKLCVGGQSFEYNTVRDIFPRISSLGVGLMNQFLTYNPAWRITAVGALHHEYFSEAPLPCSIMPTFPSSLPHADHSSTTSSAIATGQMYKGNKRRRSS